jgi:hypothetical protein
MAAMADTAPSFDSDDPDDSDSDNSFYCDVPDTYATIHNNMLVICWKCFNGQEVPNTMRFVNVCLSKYEVVKDVMHPIKDGFTHFWIERQAMETGKENIRQEILQGELLILGTV